MLALLAGLVLTLLKIPADAANVEGRAGRAAAAGDRAQPRFIMAVVCGVVSYAMMNLMMTSAPLAMVDCGHSVADATLGIQWHVLGMFAPSFVTGGLIVRFGVERIVLPGWH